ncbi:Cytosine deaminase [compost metagenome]
MLEAGLHICHMLGYRNLQSALDLVTDNSARALNLGERYGLEPGRPANLLILSADSDYEVIRSQGLALYSVRGGKVLMKREMAVVEFLR